MFAVLDLGHVLSAGPRQRDDGFIVVVANDQMLAAGEAVKPVLELCRIVSATEGKISQDPEVIIVRDTALEVCDQGRVHLRG
ncbi:hypothetical protein BFP70_14735 [Thioclava sp. SK-1]|uniref:hypothetical protein n=1 Tax=Thioclava sp. SK-1 TaxID=1889770 RepID=UPI0008246E1E|nr:hypothetical protein [Thioclava sp. SK-1]OCX61571.1 hypothetical protein BFP70_14735 [Thioclava sp. SK-1]